MIPIAPHIYFTQFLDDDDPQERRLGLDMGLELLKLCSELWVFGNRLSEGMKGEIENAKRLGIPIQYFNDKCEKLNLLKEVVQIAQEKRPLVLQHLNEPK